MAGLGSCPTVNVAGALATPPTVTTTLTEPDNPLGTTATMLLALQLFTVAFTPPNVTVFAPCIEPMLAPEMVTGVPAGPEVGDRLLICGPVVGSTVRFAVATRVMPALVP